MTAGVVFLIYFVLALSHGVAIFVYLKTQFPSPDVVRVNSSYWESSIEEFLFEHNLGASLLGFAWPFLWLAFLTLWLLMVLGWWKPREPHQ